MQKILVYNLDFIKGRRFHLFCCHWNVYFRYLTLSPCPPISNFRNNLDCGCQPASVRSSSISPHNAGESIQVRPDTSQHGHSELQAHPPTSSGVESSGEAGNQHQKDGEGVHGWRNLLWRCCLVQLLDAKDERGSSPDTDEAVELGFWHPLGVAAVCLWKR